MNHTPLKEMRKSFQLHAEHFEVQTYKIYGMRNTPVTFLIDEAVSDSSILILSYLIKNLEMRSPQLAHLNSLKKSNTDKLHAEFLHLVPGAHTKYPHNMQADV